MADKRKPLIAVVAGGTGGHIFPALVVARCLCKRGIAILWLGSRDGLEAELIPAQGFLFESVNVRGLRGKGFNAWLLAPLWLSFSFWRVLRIFLQQRPLAVLGMGGFVSAPGGVAAFVANIPLLIHEQNAVAGLANRLLKPLSKRVLTGFPDVLLSKRTSYVGNPVRDSFASLSPHSYRDSAEKLRLLVVGGSLGAAVFNRVVPRAVARMEAQFRPRVKHQCGRGRMDEMRESVAAAAVAIECFEFEERMDELYRWADIVLCRAGAMTVAEVATAGVAAIMVPFPHAVDDHQTANARFLSDAGGAILMPEQQFTATSLAATLTRYSRDKLQLKRIAAQAFVLATHGSGERIAAICCEEAGL